MAIDLLAAFEREPPALDFVRLGSPDRMKLRTAISLRWRYKFVPSLSAAPCKGQKWFIAGGTQQTIQPPAPYQVDRIKWAVSYELPQVSTRISTRQEDVPVP